MQNTHSWAAFGAGLLLQGFALSARADEPAAADVGAARVLGQEGMKLADAGNCVDAIDRLARAEKLYHAPTTQARLGECQIATGKIVEGTENLNRVIRETLPATAPPPFFAAQERAKVLYAEAKPKIAMLKIAVAVPTGIDPVVTIDGERVPVANLNAARPTNPGTHLVEASAPGFRKASQKVQLAEGGADSVALTLEADPNAPTQGPVAAEPLAPPVAPAPQKSSIVAPAVAFGAGAIGITVGAIFGALALGKKGELEDACGPSRTSCPATSQGDLDSGKTFGTVSTVGFLVGGVGVAAGAVMLITGWPKIPSARRGSVKVEPRIGLGGLALGGSF